MTNLLFRTGLANNLKPAAKIDKQLLAGHLLPRHVAIIMDGNGRWAQRRCLPRVAGHRAGIDSVHATVATCLELKIEVLTLFAFSSENWLRPRQEVNFLMNLFQTVLAKEIKKLHENNIQLRVIGERSALNPKLVESIGAAETLTENNTGLKLNLAVNYGGRWDIVQATRQLAEEINNQHIHSSDITEELLSSKLQFADFPDPDLFIRTSGEIRLSNFMIWQMAYTEMVFVDVMWPEFTEEIFLQCLDTYSKRDRRFGQTEEQLNRA